MLAVAAVAHEFISGLDWPEAFVLGAIVSPTDPTASTAIAERLGLPTRLGLADRGREPRQRRHCARRLPLRRRRRGDRELLALRRKLALRPERRRGIGVGLVVGYLIRQPAQASRQPAGGIAIALLSGYLGYLPAQALGVSGVLAAVTVGIYMGWHTPELTTVQTRLQGQAVWEIVFLLLNGLLFAFLGCSCRRSSTPSRAARPGS
jgi:CPA1 family monovalent cation:H+ antiporter